MLHQRDNNKRLMDVEGRGKVSNQLTSSDQNRYSMDSSPSLRRSSNEAPTRRQRPKEDNDDNELDWYHRDQLVASARSRARGNANALAKRASLESGSNRRSYNNNDQIMKYVENDTGSTISNAQQNNYQSMFTSWKSTNNSNYNQSSNMDKDIKQAPVTNETTRKYLDNLNSQTSTPRPVSVLSNSSSVATKRSTLSKFLLGSAIRKSPSSNSGSQRDNRIPLGPRSAQHFVTNSRRRRRANELVLEALEARRRALAINRQNAASLYGSTSYLDQASDQFYSNSQLPIQSRISLTPSPILINDSISHQINRQNNTPSPISKRPALSDLGTNNNNNRQINSNNDNNNQSMLSNRLMKKAENNINKLSNENNKKKKKASPLSRSKSQTSNKLDQNSSDLCTTNSSSDSSSSQISSSDESRFTQLVTSDLVAPDYNLLEISKKIPLKRVPIKMQANSRVESTVNSKQTRPQSSVSVRGFEMDEQNKYRSSVNENNNLRNSLRAPVKPIEPETSTVVPDKESSLGFKRGVLNRDSIRRFRLSGRRSASNDPSPIVNKPSRSDNSQLQQSSKQTLERDSSSEIKPRFLAQNGRSRSFDEASYVREKKQTREQNRSIITTESNYKPVPKPRNISTSNTKEPTMTHSNWQSTNQANKSKHPWSSDIFKESAASIKEMEKILNQVRPSQPPPPVPMIRKVESQTISSDSYIHYTRENRTVLNNNNKNRLQATTYFTTRPVKESQNSSTSRTRNGPSSAIQNNYEHNNMNVREYHTIDSRNERTSDDFSERRQQDPYSSQRIMDISPPARFADFEPKNVIDRKRIVGNESQSKIDRSNGCKSSLDHPKMTEHRSLKFEPSGKDELEKRVDQLRRLARSNSIGPIEDERYKQNSAQQSVKLVKPLSTNWKPFEDLSLKTDEKSISQSLPRKPPPPPPPISPKPRLTSKEPTESLRISQTTTTDLDSLVISSGYFPNRKIASEQSPRAPYIHSKANSSLGSSQPMRPWPRIDSTRSSASTLDEPKQESQLMRLVVKEKSAPRLDFAIVEKQPSPVVQEAREINPFHNIQPEASPYSKQDFKPIPSNRRQQPVVVASGPMRQLSPTFTGEESDTRQHDNKTTRGSLLMTSNSDCSPGSSGPSNSMSTNDDSAIASSISSPSLNSNPITQINTPTNPKTFQMHKSQRQTPTLTHGILRQRPYSLGPHMETLRDLQMSSDEIENQSRINDSSDFGRSHPNLAGGSSNQRRVHFNDRASVRSFESISSLASNSTAIQNDENTNDAQRGPQNEIVFSPSSSFNIKRHIMMTSPDSSSLCSSSAAGSRLDTDSPDFKSIKSSEAAIYAVRGDPELEDMPSEHMSPHLTSIMPRDDSLMNTQTVIPRPPDVGCYPYEPYQVQRNQQNIRMTAPPAIGSSNPRAMTKSGYNQPDNIIQAGGVTSQRPMLMRQHTAPTPMVSSRPSDDDEDISYASRLRQAAQSRAYSQYHFKSMQTLPQQQQQRRSLTSDRDVFNLQTEV